MTIIGEIDLSGTVVVGPPPAITLYEHNVENYGAVGDCELISNGSITNGTNTLTTTSTLFVSADVGKSITVVGAGPTGSNLNTTISGFTSSSSIVLTTTAGTTATTTQIVYGTDNTVAINAAATAALSFGGILIFPAGKNFFFTDTIIIQCDVNGVGATLTTGHTDLAPAVQFGTTSDYTRKKVASLPLIVNSGKTAAGWSGSDVGLEIVNVYESEIYIPHVKYFSTGLWLTSTGVRGCVYNNVFIGHLENNKINLKIFANATTAWVNQNTFLGGRYSHNNALEGDNVSGVRQILISANSNYVSAPNSNVFINTSLEGDAPEYHLESIGGNRNYFYSCRWEATIPKVYWNEASASLTSRYNFITSGYQAESIVFTSSTNSRQNTLFNSNSLIIDSNPGAGAAVLYMRNITSTLENQIILLDPTTNPLTGSPNTDYSVGLGASYSKYKVAADTEPRLRITHSTGKCEWGPGGSTALDTNLFRLSANALRTDGSMSASGFSAFTTGLANYAAAANSLFRVATTGGVCERNIADANTCFTAYQVHASSTGNIMDFKNSGGVVSWVTKTGAVKIASQAAPTATKGMLWIDSTQQVLGVYLGNSDANSIMVSQAGVLYTSTADAASTTTAETKSLIGTGVGTMTLPASFLVVGKTLRLTCAGYISTGGTAGTITFFAKVGGVTIATTGAVAPRTSMSSRPWQFQIIATCRAVGSGTSANFFCTGAFNYQPDATSTDTTTSTTLQIANAAVSSGLDSTASNLVDFLSTTSNNGHVITCANALLEVLN